MDATSATPKRWRVLCNRIGLDHHWSDTRYAMLAASYGESHRAYHTLWHISYCLEQLNEHRALAKNFDAVEFALWMHDIVYYTQVRPKGLPSNESLSAEIADEMLRDDIVGMGFREQVYGLIMATLHTPETACTPDEKLIADIDWSSLGVSWEEFCENGNRIRKEYGFLTDTDFRTGRIEWIRTALKRPHQFHLQEFRDRFEVPTNDNLARAFREYSVAASQ